MLSWPAGSHPNDGNWARYWYGNVYETTGFENHTSKPIKIPSELSPMLVQARQLYDHLAEYKL